MREIKFRAWDTNENVMCPVSVINFAKGAFLIGNSPTEESVSRGGRYIISGIDSGHFVDFDRIKLMQYTGLKDKNNQDRCEGDIIKRFTGYTFTEEKKWFSLGSNNHAQCYGYDYHPDDEIIGNIYQHPHLINKTV